MKYFSQKNQQGIALVITFLLMTIMLAIVLSLSTILFNQIKITANMSSSIGAYYSAESGLEKTLYADRKQIPLGARRGICSICNTCSGALCSSCALKETSTGGCDANICNSCQVSFKNTGETSGYEIVAVVRGSLLDISARGYFKDAWRDIQVRGIK